MKSKSNAADESRIRIVAPTAALASGLAAPLAWAGPGDLDPGFGDVGRVSGLPNLTGRAWSLDTADEDVLFGGFDDYCYYYCDYTGFTGRLGADGALDAAFAAARLEDTDVRDVVVQTDGKPVAVGSRHASTLLLVVFRLNADGSLDTNFGNGGIVEVAGPPGSDLRGTSVVLGPGDRITVAGMQGDDLLVMRFLADGSVDTSFGTNGAFVWGSALIASSPPKLVRVGTGGYRVMVTTQNDRLADPALRIPDCRVLGLTEAGALDPMYGTAGVADVFTDDLLPNSCSSIGAQQDGRVVVGGRSAASPAQGFARRLLSTGAVDSLFTADAVGSSMSEVTALAVAANGSIAVAGRESPGLSGALVVRLQADGHLDAMFGRQGRTVFDVESDGPVWPIVHDMQVLPDGGIVMSGGTGTWSSQRPFVVRLLGDGAGGGPGVVDIEASSNQAHEADQLARIDVRRIGGRSGPISVTYRTEAANDYPIASPGMDFTAVEGQLTWADGDDSVRTITVPVADDAEPPERPEHFLVRISAPSGGAGLAKRTSIVTIVGDGFPAGLIDVSSIPAIREGHVLTVNVSRRDYAAGAVTVDLSITGGSATAGEDYLVPGEPLRLSWADGDSLDKSIGIAIRDDDRVEPGETIVVALSGATGGAVIGTSSTVEVAIIDDDAGGGRNGGGGRIGGLFALLSGFAGWLRSRRRSAA